MKLLNSFETSVISGGTIMSFDGKSVYVDTTGIPSYCVSGMEAMYNIGLAELKNPYATQSSLENALLPYAEAYLRSGCNPYTNMLVDRINVALS